MAEIETKGPVATTADDRREPSAASGAPSAAWNALIQRKIIQRRARRAAEAEAEAEVVGTSSSGSALPPPVQAKMESSFGADFSSVRVHQGDQATTIGAAAYASGTDIHFAPGQYDPHSRGGQELIGHELAHVVQQSEGRVSAPTQAKGGINDDPALEHEADVMGARAAQGEPARESGHSHAVAGGGGPLQLKRLAPIELGKLRQDVYKNVRAGNAKLALFGVKARVEHKEVDKEDVDDISEFSYGFELEKDTMTHYTEANSEKAFDFLGQWKVEVLKLKGDAADPSEVAAPGDTAPVEGFTELVPGPGKQRVLVPTAKAGETTLHARDTVRWSQSDVKAETQGEEGQQGVPLTDVVSHMVKGGWRGDPCTAVDVKAQVTLNGKQTPSGAPAGLTSQDNRRLLGAMTAGLPQVPCIVKQCEDALPSTWKVEHRDKIRKALYYDKVKKEMHYGAAGEGFNKRGAPEDPSRFELVLPKNHIAQTYGELIFIRSANQPGVMSSEQEFPIGGSSDAPYFKDK